MGAAGFALAVATFVFGVALAAAFSMHMAGTLDPVIEWFTEKLFKAEARVEEKALEKAGSEKAQSILKGMFWTKLLDGGGQRGAQRHFLLEEIQTYHLNGDSEHQGLDLLKVSIPANCDSYRTTREQPSRPQ